MYLNSDLFSGDTAACLNNQHTLKCKKIYEIILFSKIEKWFLLHDTRFTVNAVNDNFLRNFEDQLRKTPVSWRNIRCLKLFSTIPSFTKNNVIYCLFMH